MADHRITTSGARHFTIRHGGRKAQTFDPKGPGPGEAIVADDHGGYLIQRGRVVLIFWGTKWRENVSPSMKQVIEGIKSLLDSAYMTGLAQYRAIRPATLLATDLADDDDPPRVFSDGDIADKILSRIEAGKVPGNSFDESDLSRTMYFVVLPTGHVSSDHDGIGTHFPLGNSYGGWVGNDGSLDSFNSTPHVFSHELVESCADPDLGSGIILPDVTIQGETEDREIADPTEDVVLVDGVARTTYFSRHDRKFIAPSAYSVKWFFSVAGKDPSKGLLAALSSKVGRINVKELLYSIIPG